MVALVESPMYGWLPRAVLMLSVGDAMVPQKVPPQESLHEPMHARAPDGWTWFDAMALRFESFTLDEAEAIVAYLKFRAERDPEWRRKIGESLRNYWNPRLLYLARRPR